MGMPGLWQVDGGTPRKLTPVPIALESDLESWIEADPTLLEGGLAIVGRQLQTQAGPLDLLAVDGSGTLVVVEIKRDALTRDAITQALDYASCLNELTEEELDRKTEVYLRRRHGEQAKTLSEMRAQRRGIGATDEEVDDIAIYLVGTKVEPALARMVDFLSSTGSIPIRLVTIGAYRLETGQTFLLRELTESDAPVPGGRQWTSTSLDELEQRAAQSGVGEGFRILRRAAEACGLYPRIWKESVMYAPQAKKNRSLFTVWARGGAGGAVGVWVVPGAFPEFFPVTREQAVSALGEGERRLSTEDASSFARNLEALILPGRRVEPL